ITIDVPEDIFQELSPVRKLISAESIIRARDALKPDGHRHIVERRAIVARAARKPTFASCIDRVGGPPKPAVQQRVLPTRPVAPLPWIEIFTAEGRLLLYSGLNCVGRPIEWRVRFDPCSTSRITWYGDKSTNCQRDMADGYLLNFLVHGCSVYHPWGSDLPIIVLAMPVEIVREPTYATLSDDLLDITASDLPPTNAQDVPAITHDSEASILTAITPVQLDVDADCETSVALDRREDTRSAERVNEPVTTNAENNAHTQTPAPVAIGREATSQEAPLSPTPTAPANSRVPGLYHTSHSLPGEQREAVHQELRSGLPLWTQQARQRHSPQAEANAWIQASQGGIAVESHMEKSQPKEAPKRIKRRGGKKNELWKRKCRERRDHHEHNPGAGPSGLH
ncbi:hypothetical protein FRC01_014252, partial [Tulasnella sp. 417]